MSICVAIFIQLRNANRNNDHARKVIGRWKMEKHVELTIEEKGFRYTRDEASIADEAALDGMVAVRISLQGSAEEMECQYK